MTTLVGQVAHTFQPTDHRVTFAQSAKLPDTRKHVILSESGRAFREPRSEGPAVAFPVLKPHQTSLSGRPHSSLNPPIGCPIHAVSSHEWAIRAQLEPGPPRRPAAGCRVPCAVCPTLLRMTNLSRAGGPYIPTHRPSRDIRAKREPARYPKTCHPERSGRAFCEPRSRRTCGCFSSPQTSPNIFIAPPTLRSNPPIGCPIHAVSSHEWAIRAQLEPGPPRRLARKPVKPQTSLTPTNKMTSKCRLVPFLQLQLKPGGLNGSTQHSAQTHIH